MLKYSTLTPYGSLIATVHVRHSRVIRGGFCSLDLTPLSIPTFYRVTIPLNHERQITLVVTATVTYAVAHGAGSTVRAKFSRVYTANQCDVVADLRVVAQWLRLCRRCCWFCQTRSHGLVESASVRRKF